MAVQCWWTCRRFFQGLDGSQPLLPSLAGLPLPHLTALLQEATTDWQQLRAAIVDRRGGGPPEAREYVRDWVAFMSGYHERSEDGRWVIDRLIREELQ